MDNQLKFFTNKLFILFAIIAFLTVSSFFYELRAVSGDSANKIFEISPGEGFFQIVGRLKDEKLIRSKKAFEVYAVARGLAGRIRPGIYELSGNLSALEIAVILSESANEAEVIIPDGASVYDIDALLNAKKILPAGFLTAFSEENDIEGKLYPDTYKFFEHSSPEVIAAKFLENFRAKAEPILKKDPIHYAQNLILASFVQKEVSDPTDSRIVAGILKKRLSVGMKLDVDATICYIKKTLRGQFSCYPFIPEDFKIDSPYNTYLRAGLPPGPIGSPNKEAISAVLNATPSPYWFYLSDPKTGKTIFSKTLDEQSANRAIYLR
ncbi:MAG: endolytic transglycosylase MltG [Candidatus Liptonbacteria bacterium]|nr:endolytic transglycosylase MltG [Candidatus Liptonbacteria bacterium]